MFGVLYHNILKLSWHLAWLIHLEKHYPESENKFLMVFFVVSLLIKY